MHDVTIRVTGELALSHLRECLGEARSILWHLVQQGDWPDVDVARDALRAVIYIDRTLERVNGPLSQLSLWEHSRSGHLG